MHRVTRPARGGCNDRARADKGDLRCADCCYRSFPGDHQPAKAVSTETPSPCTPTESTTDMALRLESLKSRSQPTSVSVGDVSNAGNSGVIGLAKCACPCSVLAGALHPASL